MKYIYTTVLLFLSFILNAQDAHFSQIQNTTTFNNPAQLGTFIGDIRASLHYKNQWASVASPYSTYAFSFDAGLLKDKIDNGYLGAGITVYNDKAGDNKFATTKVDLGISYHISANVQNTITAGVVGGFNQSSIDQTNMQWDNQYDGTGYNPAYASGETRSFEPMLKFDVGGGLQWNFHTSETNMASNDGFKMVIGFATWHANTPNYSLVNVAGEKQYRKYAVNANSFIGVKQTNLAVKPAILIQLQGPNTEIIAGTMLRYILNEGSKITGNIKESALSVGGYYRVGDSFIPSMMIEYANYAFGVSYDMNISSLKAASQSKGGIEIMFRFVNPNPFAGHSGQSRL